MKKILFLVVVMILTTNILSAASNTQYTELYNFIVKSIDNKKLLKKGETPIRVNGFEFKEEYSAMQADKEYATGDYSVRDEIYEAIRINVIEKLKKKYKVTEVKLVEKGTESTFDDYGYGYTTNATVYGWIREYFSINGIGIEFSMSLGADFSGTEEYKKYVKKSPAYIQISLFEE